MSIHDSSATRSSLRHLFPGLIVLASFSVVPVFAEGTAGSIIPATTEHQYATRPVIAGEITAVSERRVDVSTEQGEALTLQMDSRTVVPSDLAPGMVMRAEFQVMDDGTFYAKRIVPLRDGMRRDREIAYARGVTYEGTEASDVSTGEVAEGTGDEHVDHVDRVTRQPLGTSIQAVPATHAYVLATEPRITGVVTSVNDHALVVATEDGEHTTLAMDSRTLVPSDLATGMPVEIEFTTMKNDDRSARRIVPLRGEGWWDRDGDGRRTAMSESEVRESGEDAGVGGARSDDASSIAGAGSIEASDGSASPADRAREESPDRLPQTASRQPLTALLGVSAITLAGLMWLTRRRRSI